ncbi:hypothetical protein, partial [Ensifer aridi]|uniref:hypothetical protein n=1 Tax=Ensifer aridi TaxID=1708715 RepID=UPI001AECAC41
DIPGEHVIDLGFRTFDALEVEVYPSQTTAKLNGEIIASSNKPVGKGNRVGLRTAWSSIQFSDFKIYIPED